MTKGSRRRTDTWLRPKWPPNIRPKTWTLILHSRKSVALLKGDILIPVAGFLHLPQKNVQRSVASSSSSSSLDRIWGFPMYVLADCLVINLFECSYSPNMKKVAFSSHILGVGDGQTQCGSQQLLLPSSPIAPLFSHQLDSRQHVAAPFPPPLIFGLNNFLFSWRLVRNLTQPPASPHVRSLARRRPLQPPPFIASKTELCLLTRKRRNRA